MQHIMQTLFQQRVREDKAIIMTHGVMTGDLTMHGVTRSMTLQTERSGTIKDPWGLTRSSISMEGKIKRSDFGLKYNQVLEAGGVAIGDEIKCSIELQGIAQ